jgi:hypothetical protein
MIDVSLNILTGTGIVESWGRFPDNQHIMLCFPVHAGFLYVRRDWRGWSSNHPNSPMPPFSELS